MFVIAAPSILVAITTVLLVAFFPNVVCRFPFPFQARIQRLQELGIDRFWTCSIVITLLIASAGMVAWLGIVRGQYVIAAAVVPLVWAALGWGLGECVVRRERLLRNQLAEVAIVMSGAVRAGMTPALSLARSAADAPAPLAAVLQRIVRDYERGVPLRAAMKAAGDRLALDSFTLMVTAINVTLELGGRLDEALDRIADSINNQQRLEDKLSAATASGRSALLLMAVFPFAFSAFSYQLDPGGYEVITASFAGQLGIGCMLLMVYLALRWGKAILDQVAN